VVELVERFGTNERRREILAGLLRALQALKAAGCRRAYVDGSFVTSKEVPVTSMDVGTTRAWTSMDWTGAAGLRRPS